MAIVCAENASGNSDDTMHIFRSLQSHKPWQTSTANQERLSADDGAQFDDDARVIVMPNNANVPNM